MFSYESMFVLKDYELLSDFLSFHFFLHLGGNINDIFPHKKFRKHGFFCFTPVSFLFLKKGFKNTNRKIKHAFTCKKERL